MRNLILLFFFLIIGISCSDENEEEDFRVNLDTGMYITLVNQEGTDLLDPISSFTQAEEIKIFHKVDGVLTEFYAPSLDTPKGFRLISPEAQIYNDLYLFSLGMTNRSHFTGEFEEQTTTYIQWNETDMDTVKCENINTRTTGVFCTKVWYNGNLVWDHNNSEDHISRWFVIVKTL